MAKLYIIATPIGNRLDLTLRALEIFKGLNHIYAEDTREIAKLLELHGIDPKSKKLHSYASHNMKEATNKAISLLQEGEDLGLVSDRGTPAISDPGALLVDKARELGVEVYPIPGASSVTALLSVSGWDVVPFVFYGFWPTAQGEAKRLVETIQKHRMLSCFLESPQRVRETARQLKAGFPDGKLCWGREMTKTFEEYQVLPLVKLEPEGLQERGEYTLLLNPGASAQATPEAWEEEIRLRLASEKDWAKAVGARFGVASKEIYNALQELKRQKM